MGATSNLRASQTPALGVVPISDGSGAPGESLNAWVSDGSGGVVNAEDVFYSNGSSGLAANNVQDAIDELALSVGSGSFDLQAELNALSTTHGAIIFRGASLWEALEPGTPGYFLMTNGSGADPSWQPIDAPNVIYSAWVAAVDAAGGTYETDSKDIALALSDALVAFSGFAKIKWLLPLLGANLIAARVPLIDTLGVGIAGNTAFVDADFDQATGLQGNGSSKYLDSLIKASDLGSSNNGGLGWWENNINLAGNVEPMGAYNNAASTRYVLDLRSTLAAFRWGSPGNSASNASTAVNGHYYGQRSSSSSREIFLDGVSLATNTASDATSGANERNLLVVGADEGGAIAPWPGRCAVAYMTDGTLTPTEITDLHTLLDTFLITPTGR